MASLESLPDSLLLDIIDKSDTARDVARLASLSRRTNALVRQDGWKSFVKKQFPSLTTPLFEPTSWSNVADRLTYLDRCWEKRGLSVTFFQEKREKGPGRYRQSGKQSVQSHSVLDARVLSSSDDELLVWGAGENLVVRLRSHGKELQDDWDQLDGQAIGYFPGTGDITAISVTEWDGCPEVVIGRANGDLQLLDATEDGFGQPTQTLTPAPESDFDHRPASMRKSPGQLAVSWTEWNAQSNLLASCKSSVLTLHDLSQTGDEDLKPVAYYDVSRDSAAEEVSLIRNAKFMGTDVIVCALGGSWEPLRWSKIRPTGLEFVGAARNSDPLDRVANKTEVTIGEKTTVRAVEPVGNGNMVLSAWDDGTLRLSDIRTPSNQDAVYRDRFQPYQASSSLLVYGAQRFVAGNNSGTDIRFFDFRAPTPYHHTAALPCSAESPSPPRSYHREAPGVVAADIEAPASTCDGWNGRQCRWHAESACNSWRPDATMYFGRPAYDRISSLTKASDSSESFYCGARGAVVEVNLKLAEDAIAKGVSRTAPPGWTATRATGISLMETGVGLCSSTDDWLDDFNGVPKLYQQKKAGKLGQPNPGAGSAPSRLDSTYRVAGM